MDGFVVDEVGDDNGETTMVRNDGFTVGLVVTVEGVTAVVARGLDVNGGSWRL